MKQEKSVARIMRVTSLLSLIFFACFAFVEAQSITPFLDCVEPVLQNSVPTGELRDGATNRFYVCTVAVWKPVALQ
jgi:hypothetical protein